MSNIFRIATSLAIIAAVPPATRAQLVPGDTLAEVRALRDARRFDAAVGLLQAYVGAHPEDVVAAGLLGETLYWMKRPADARVVYEASLSRHPDDARLRLLYGRMLIETEDGARAREIVGPLVGTDASGGWAEALLGTLAYWEGDFATARRFFSAALGRDSSIAEARRSLRDILLVASPRLGIAAHRLDDDQPLDRDGFDLFASAFITPLVGVTARAEPLRFRLVDGSTARVTTATAGVSAYVPAIRSEIEAVAGRVSRTDGSAWIGRVGIGFRVPGRLQLRARAERAPYLSTVASVSTSVIAETFGATIDWSHPRGWIGQIATTMDRFPDDNVVGTGSAWILAPVVRSASTEVQLGYAVTLQGAEESRYEIRSVGQPAPGGPPPTGSYEPYFTPLDLRSHSMVGSVVTRAGSRLVLRGGGSFGLSARETAPVIERRPANPPQPPTDVVVFAPRSFTPWSARVGVDAAVSRWLSVAVLAEAVKTAFYRSSSVRAGLVHVLPSPSLRRLGPQ